MESYIFKTKSDRNEEYELLHHLNPRQEINFGKQTVNITFIKTTFMVEPLPRKQEFVTIVIKPMNKKKGFEEDLK